MCDPNLSKHFSRPSSPFGVMREDMSSDVLRSMVLSFRLHELQVFLQFAKKNKVGKKADLQVRRKHGRERADPR